MSTAGATCRQRGLFELLEAEIRKDRPSTRPSIEPTMSASDISDDASVASEKIHNSGVPDLFADRPARRSLLSTKRLAHGTASAMPNMWPERLCNPTVGRPGA
jgi:hypothetical protein